MQAAESEKEIAEAREEFERADMLWQQASKALLRLQSQTGAQGESRSTLERLQEQIVFATEEQAAARFFRDQAWERLTLETVERKRLTGAKSPAVQARRTA